MFENIDPSLLSLSGIPPIRDHSIVSSSNRSPAPGLGKSSSVAGLDEVCTMALDYDMLEEDPTDLDDGKSRAFVPENPLDVVASGMWQQH
jgi:hypothetical protein